MGDNGRRSKPFWDYVKVGNPDDCWEWQAVKNNYGYGYYRINGGKVSAHRYAYELHNGPIPPHTVIMHLCDNPPCCNPNHLNIGTQQQNIQDCASKNRIHRPIGEKNVNAKLDEEKVKEIRLLHEQGNTYAAIAALFEVSPSVIGDVVRYQIWKHV